MKEIDLGSSIYDLTEQHPELIDILKEMGFFGVAHPAVRNTLGRATTLAQGCERQGKDLNEVIAALKEHGFTVKAQLSHTSPREAIPSEDGVNRARRESSPGGRT